MCISSVLMHRDVTPVCSSCSPVKTAGHAAHLYFAVLILTLAFAAPVGSWSLAGESWRASPCKREPGWHNPKLPPAVACASRAEFPQPLQVSSSSVTPAVLHGVGSFHTGGISGEPSSAITAGVTTPLISALRGNSASSWRYRDGFITQVNCTHKRTESTHIKASVPPFFFLYL